MENEEEEEDDVVYVDDNEMDQMEAMADEEEANALAEQEDEGPDDFETYQESEFGEGDEYQDG